MSMYMVIYYQLFSTPNSTDIKTFHKSMQKECTNIALCRVVTAQGKGNRQKVICFEKHDHLAELP